MRLEEEGHLSATRRRMGEVIQFGPFLLKREENARVWGLIERVHISSLASSTSMGRPDEVMYTFTLQTDSSSHTAELWQGDVQTLPQVREVVVELKGLIEKHTGLKAYL